MVQHTYTLVAVVVCRARHNTKWLASHSIVQLGISITSANSMLSVRSLRLVTLFSQERNAISFDCVSVAFARCLSSSTVSRQSPLRYCRVCCSCWWSASPSEVPVIASHANCLNTLTFNGAMFATKAKPRNLLEIDSRRHRQWLFSHSCAPS